MTRVGFYIAVFFVISTLAFNNCVGKFEVKDAVSSLTGASAQCQQKMRSTLRVADFGEPSSCEDPANYACDLRRFRSGLASERAPTTQCVDIAGLGTACIPVVTYNYDTRSQRMTASPEDALEGGAYNRDEVTCIHTKFFSQHIALIQVEAATVPKAIESAVEECRRRSRQ